MKATEYFEKYMLNKKLMQGIRNDSYREAEEEELAKRLEAENEEIKKTIHSLGYPYSDIIIMRYFRGLTLKIIASKLYYEYSYIIKMNTKALKMLEEKINKEDAKDE